MALPTIVYNASTGSDTAASGAGPGTAVTGTAAAHTGGSASTTITLTNSPDLSGVATDGSAAIWLNTTAGTRHLSKITAVDNGADTVTVEDSFTIASGSAVNYAIGGKRAGPQNDTSRRDLLDGKAGWIFEYENGTYTWTAAQDITVGDATNGPLTVRAASGASPEFAVSGTIHLFALGTSSCVVIRGISFTPSASRYAILLNAASNTAVIENCKFHVDGDTSVGISVLSTAAYVSIRNCYFENSNGVSGGSGISFAGTRYHATISCCEFDGCDTYGIDLNSGTALSSVMIDRCLIYGGEFDGIRIQSNIFDRVYISHCTLHDNASDGIDITSAAAIEHLITVYNCLFTSNGAYGLKGPTNADFNTFSNYNAFYNNTSGARQNCSAGANDVTLTGDPYTNAAGKVFTLNNTASAGAACRAAGFPGAFGGGLTTGYLDIGAVQHQDSGGGSGGGPIMGGMVVR